LKSFRLTKEISIASRQIGVDGQRTDRWTDGQPENMLPPPPVS